MNLDISLQRSDEAAKGVFIALTALAVKVVFRVLYVRKKRAGSKGK